MLSNDERRQVSNRLNRIIGQAEGTRRMVEEGRYSIDVLLQVHAMHAALERVGRIILDTHIRTCVKAALDADTETASEERVNALLDAIDRYSWISHG